jgi:pantoate--beta-alanine ligase
MIRQLALPIEIIAAETIREASGLARSSRNAYLTDAQRLEAAQLSATLRALVGDVRSGRRDWDALEYQAMDSLRRRGWHPDYVTVRTQADLSSAVEGQPLVALAAGKLGHTRLIDNLEI